MPLPFDLVLALVAFAFVTSITPGPNNMMLLASGVNFGFRRTIPHMLGIGIGFTLMVIVVGLGLGELLGTYPALYAAMQVAGAAYLLWLAWGLATTTGRIGGAAAAGRPMSFLGAAAFQWVNPKAWTMAVGAVATYARADAHAESVLLIALVFGAVNLPSVGSWALFGAGLQRTLADPGRLRRFNLVMAGLLVASLWPLIAALRG